MKKPNYKYYEHELKNGAKEVIAVSSYAGKKVKGKAVCSPDDEYDVEIGKKLAAYRLDVKVDEKRLKRAETERDVLIFWQRELDKLFEKNKIYLEDSIEKLMEDDAKLAELLDELS